VNPVELFLGFRPKRRTPCPDGLGVSPVVREICSASDCIASAPEGWLDTWRFNRAYCFESAESAMALVAEPERAAFDAYAFWLQATTRDGSGRAIDVDLTRLFDARLPALPTDSGPSWPTLGFDVVSLEAGFGHSPLSCNGMAKEIAVNQHCLLATLDEAFTVAALFNSEESHVEPEEYFIVRLARLPS
jgi:hypothetical protein